MHSVFYSVLNTKANGFLTILICQIKVSTKSGRKGFIMTFQKMIRSMIENSCKELLYSFYTTRAREALPAPYLIDIKFKDCEQGKYFVAEFVTQGFCANPIHIMQRRYDVVGFMSEKGVKTQRIISYATGNARIVWFSSPVEMETWDIPQFKID